MAAGLGGLFADAFPEVPTLDEIEVGFTFSKKDAAHLAALIDVPAVPLVEAVASSGLKADVITNILSLIGTAYATFLSGLSVTLPVAATSPTSDSNALFHTPVPLSATQVVVTSGAAAPPPVTQVAVAGGAAVATERAGSVRDLITRSEAGEPAGAAQAQAAMGTELQVALVTQAGAVEAAKAAYEGELRRLQLVQAGVNPVGATGLSALSSPSSLSASRPIGSSLPPPLPSPAPAPALVPPAAVAHSPAPSPEPAPPAVVPAPAPVPAPPPPDSMLGLMQLQMQQFQFMQESQERQRLEAREETRMLMAQQKAHSDEMLARVSLQMAQQQSVIDGFAAKKSGEVDVKLDYVPRSLLPLSIQICRDRRI